MNPTKGQIEAWREENQHRVLLKMQVDALCDLALSALEQDWRPIAEAPKDGTWVECWDSGPFPIVGRWTAQRKSSEIGWASREGYSLAPTHYRPLPSPPSSKEKP